MNTNGLSFPENPATSGVRLLYNFFDNCLSYLFKNISVDSFNSSRKPAD